MRYRLLFLAALMALSAPAAPAAADLGALGALGLPEADDVLPPHTQCHLNLLGFCVIHPGPILNAVINCDLAGIC